MMGFIQLWPPMLCLSLFWLWNLGGWRPGCHSPEILLRTEYIHFSYRFKIYACPCHACCQ
jgi:hypothetical protein